MLRLELLGHEAGDVVLRELGPDPRGDDFAGHVERLPCAEEPPHLGERRPDRRTDVLRELLVAKQQHLGHIDRLFDIELHSIPTSAYADWIAAILRSRTSGSPAK